MTRAERMQRVERDNPDLPVSSQCKLLALPWSTVYYPRKPAVSDDDSLLCAGLMRSTFSILSSALGGSKISWKATGFP